MDLNNINSIHNSQNNKNKIIRIYSYNSRGFDLIKQKFCLELLGMDKNTVPVLCNQENFTLKGNDHIIRNALPDYHVFIKPATKDHLEGRPKNGMFVALPLKLRSKAKDVSPNNSRVQAILLETDNGQVMIINVYFPSDPKTKMYQIDSDLEDVFASIENVIERHPCNSVVIAGDLNTDFQRKNGRASRLVTFMSNNSLDSSWKRFECDYTHEFELDEVTLTCTIDHILWNENLSESVMDAGVLHVLGNTSDHSPIYCIIKKSFLSDSLTPPQKCKGTKNIRIRLTDEYDWKRFRIELEERLKREIVPDCINCRDVHCENESHLVEIDKYVTNILESIDGSIKKTVEKKTINAKRKTIPGWSDVVKPFREDAMF